MPSRAAPRKEWDFSGIDEPRDDGASLKKNAEKAPSRFAASRAHELNDAYLARMDEGFRALGVAENSNPLEREPVGFGNGPGRDRTSSSAKEDDEKRRETFPSFREKEDASAFFSADRWLRGPVDPAGALVHVSDRPLTCVSAAPAGDGVAVGGTDHAVRVVGVAKDDASAASAKSRRRAPAASVATLRGGHREWVTCVTHDVTRGHVVSGGMDSCVYVWARRNVFKNGSHGAPPHETVPTKLEGHGGSVSDVLADDGRVASASYDKTVRLWRLQKTQKKSVVKSVGSTATAVATLRGHRAPALCLAARLESGANADVADVRDDAFGAHAFGLYFASLASGDRGGAVLRWDAASGSLVSSRDAHEGHCTALRWVEGADPNATPLLASGGQDGAARSGTTARGRRAAQAHGARARARRGRGERNRAVRREPPRRHRGRGRVRRRARPARGPSRNSQRFFRNSFNSRFSLVARAGRLRVLAVRRARRGRRVRRGRRRARALR